MITKFAENTKGRDFFVGDLHGMYGLFVQKLAEVQFDFVKDRMFSVGDLMDRGPNSPDCIKLLNESWFHCVMGNHEELMMGSHGHNIWMYNGGEWALEEKEQLNELRDLVNDKVHSAMEVQTHLGRIGVIHAESYSIWGQNQAYDPEKHTWSRTRIQKTITTIVEDIDRVVVGHTPVKTPVRLGNVVYIDTGAYHTNNLTMLTADEIFAIEHTKIKGKDNPDRKVPNKRKPFNDKF